MDSIIDIISRLSEIPGVSGDEGKVRETITGLIKDHVEWHKADALGNLTAFKKGSSAPKNRLLYSAHMDEVGFIITMIEDSGLLRFSNVGGIDSRVVVGKALEVGPGRLPGIVGTKPVHLQKDGEKEEALPLDKLYIDIGAKDREEAEKHVSPGDRAVFTGGLTRFGGGMLMGKALDDRAGCALLIAMIRSELPRDCYFSFTVQEETGCTGAVTAGYAIEPDIAVAVETTTASDIAGVTPENEVCRLGAGPVISFMDKGTVYDHGLFTLALETAKANGIPAQVKNGVYGGNESRSLQTAKSGARTLAVSLPCRYIHSPANMLCEADLEPALDLLKAFCAAAANI